MKRRTFLQGLLGIAATATLGIAAKAKAIRHHIRPNQYLTDPDAWFLRGIDENGEEITETVYLVDGKGETKGRFRTISEAFQAAEAPRGTIVVLPTEESNYASQSGEAWKQISSS